MDWAMLGAVGELVGGAGVILSLLYLARQVKGATRREQRAGYEASVQSASTWTQSLAAQEDLASIVFRGMADLSSLTAEERFRFYSSLLTLFRAYESISQYATEGGVHDWGKESFFQSIGDFVGLPGVQTWWNDRRHWFAPQVRAEIDQMIADSTQRMLDSYEGT